MDSLDSLWNGRNYNLFYASNELSEFKRKKDNALVAVYQGRKNFEYGNNYHTFSTGDVTLRIIDIEYYRESSEDIFVNRIEIEQKDKKD